MYKAVITDLDGTLLNENSELTKETINVLRAIIKKGIKVYIVTGRYHEDTFAIKKKISENI